MSENKKNTLITELDVEELDKVVGGIYADYVGHCQYCHAKNNGKWDEELQQHVCISCHRPIRMGFIGQIQEVV